MDRDTRAEFEATLSIAGATDSSIRVLVVIADGSVRITAGRQLIGRWALPGVGVSRRGSTVVLAVEGEQLLVEADDPDALAAALGLTPVGLRSTIQALAARQAGASSPDGRVGPWRFWEGAAWRTWWGDRRAWTAHRRDPSGPSRPRRPFSPLWIPTAGVLLLVSLGGGREPDTAVLATDVETTVTTVPSTVSTRASTTTTAPPVLMLIPPEAGASGDPAAEPPSGAETVEIVAITDGDTLDVRLAGGTVEPVRLIGMNAPEQGECLADLATAVLAVLIEPGSQAQVTADVSDRDQFGRLLRYVWVGGFSVNEEMVRRGLAIARRYPPDTALADRFEGAQTAAREAGMGMWAPEACGPAADVTLRIVEVNYDPPGDDNQVLDQEWVRIGNQSDAPVDMTGWSVKDESASHRYAFPVGFTLAPGETVTLHTGCGTDFSTDLYWCNQGSAIWNNDGDTVFLIDPSGNIHVSVHYAPATTTTQARTTTTTQATTTTRAATTTLAPSTTAASNCDPSYPDVCIPPYPPDLDCGDIPYKRFRVVGSDPHGFDRDNDGVGCES